MADEKRWTLKIFYQSSEGRRLVPMRRKSCIEGLLYAVESPRVTGWVTSQSVVAVNLYADQEITVIYRRVSEA